MAREPNKNSTTRSGTKKAPNELGVGGFRTSAGWVYDEFLPELVGYKGRKKYREMADNDPTIGAVMYALTALIKSAIWSFEPAKADTSGKYSDWYQDVIYSMGSMTWNDVIEDAMSQFIHGFAIQEIITMKRPDGTIGLDKLAPRSQETIYEWDLDEAGNLLGAWQIPPVYMRKIYLPKEKIIHYRTAYNKNNPEGRSMLRNAYKAYHFISTISITEAIGAERDLSGLPVLYAPASWLGVAGNRAQAEKIVRDIKFNDQGGLVLSSDTFQDAAGKDTGTRKWELKLLAAEGGGSKVDTDKIIGRWSNSIARSILSEFLMLGDKGGSYAMSDSKTEMFLRSVQGVLESIAQTLDRQLTPILWTLNGFPEEMKPYFRAGSISPVDLQQLGDYVSKLAGAGIILSDEDTDQHLRDAAGLPQRPDEVVPPIDDNNDPENEDPDATDEEGQENGKSEDGQGAS